MDAPWLDNAKRILTAKIQKFVSRTGEALESVSMAVVGFNVVLTLSARRMTIDLPASVLKASKETRLTSTKAVIKKRNFCFQMVAMLLLVVEVKYADLIVMDQFVIAKMVPFGIHYHQLANNRQCPNVQPMMNVIHRMLVAKTF